MKYNNLLIDIDNNIATVTINRSKKLNALNKETLEELHNAFKALKDDDNVKVIILTGSGTKAFVAGADISEFADFDVSQGADLAKTGQELVFNYIENFDKPVIAAINGFALGGGLELATRSLVISSQLFPSILIDEPLSAASKFLTQSIDTDIFSVQT